MKMKRYVCLGCFKIRELKEVCCEKRAGEPFALDPYFGKGKTGQEKPWEHPDPCDITDYNPMIDEIYY
jgi:hypothetical protein